MGVLWCFILGGLLLAPTSGLAASPGDPVALLTEIRPGQGDIRVKLAAEAEWKAPLPLLSLRAGRPGSGHTERHGRPDVRGWTGNCSRSSPPIHPTPCRVLWGVHAQDKTAELVTNVTRILMGKKKELAYTPLTTRSIKQPPVILSPRDGKLLGSPVLEWTGSDRARYAVRVFGPQGPMWEQANLPQAPLPYPPNAPSLNPGVAYRWELETKDFPVQQGRFRYSFRDRDRWNPERPGRAGAGGAARLPQEHRGLDARGFSVRAGAVRRDTKGAARRPAGRSGRAESARNARACLRANGARRRWPPRNSTRRSISRPVHHESSGVAAGRGDTTPDG